ncbi:MAG: dUTP diphosphatase [Candidatus Edwardsbacteria bacterium]
MNEITVKVRFISKNAFLPEYATEGSSGMDLCAALEKGLIIPPGEVRLIPTGIALEIPPGYEGQVRPRSGLALKHQIGILNSPGTIDSDYRGEIGIILFNFGKKTFVVKPGERIAQIVFAPVVKARLKKVKTLSITRRNNGGFGHSGIKK